MQYCRLIAPKWLVETGSSRVLEGLFTEPEIKSWNAKGYNVYYTPNSAKNYTSGTLDGTHIDSWQYVFVDYDVKSGTYESKDAFIEAVALSGIVPTKIVDSGNGIHVYWRVSDLDAQSYLRLTSRLIRLLNTDPATRSIFQLMRLPNTLNTKVKDAFIPCTILFEDGPTYTCEELDGVLPPITTEDESFCQTHYDRTYKLDRENVTINDTLPPKFGKLIKENHEAKAIWSGDTSDRSKDDFRLGHIMYANDFTQAEALSVLVNSAKAMARAPVHRANYAQNIVDKIWTYEEAEDKTKVNLSPTVRDILSRGEETVKGTRFPCSRLIDDTEHGYRLTQVMGIVGGSGVGKTTLTLNAFLWFASNNPDYHHFFFSLEQPASELAARIRTICGANTALFDKIHIISNYAEDGTFTNFSMVTIEEHIATFENTTKSKVGAVVIDHIGVLDKSVKNGEQDGLIGVCRQMKATAVKLNIFLIMLSQAPREKAGIGDLELNKDAAYGTVMFESFVDYLVCLWQPLKRVYSIGAPTVMAVKFAKIRHKRQGVDRIQEDVCYQFYFDPVTERLRELTQDEETSAKYFVSQATNARKQDRKTDIVSYQSRRLDEGAPKNEQVQKRVH